MSEIFEALRKAQRQADARRLTTADSGEADAGEISNDSAAPSKPDKNREHPHAGSTRSASRRSTWLRWARRRAGRNGREEHGSALIPVHHSTPMGEQFRVLRSQIEQMGPAAFMVTSPMDQDGKTLCATNLAVALSLGIGAGVILVDADLRRSSVDAYFSIHGGPGLTHCLLGEASWQDCLVPTTYEGLHVLRAGRRTDIAPELLASERMGTVIAEIKAKFPRHYIVLDTPPVLLTSDSLVLARHADHFLLVVRAGVTPRAAVLKAIQTLGTDRFLGAILNDATDTLSNYYYYGYQADYAKAEATES